MLTRLIYASEAAQALTPDAVQTLVDQASRSNEKRHVSGLLAFDSQCFLQVLEGSRENVNHIFGRIASDPRHRHVVLLEAVAVDERQFGRWSMAFAPADAKHADLYLRYGTEPRFNPYPMRAPAALALLRAMAPAP